MSFSFKKKFGETKGVAIAELLFNEKVDNKTKKKILYYYDDDSMGEKSIFIDTKQAKFHPIPFLPSEGLHRVAPLIFGNSGSGKSVYLSKMIKRMRQTHKDYKKKKIYLFCANQECGDIDPAFSDLKLPIEKVDLNWAAGNLTIEMLRDTIVIFDDFLHTQNKAIDIFIQSLLGALLERSRKLRCSIFMILHNPRAGKSTVLPLIESTSFSGFPASNLNGLSKLCKNYLDWNMKELEYLKTLNGNGRFTSVYINKVPNYLISEDRVLFVRDITD